MTDDRDERSVITDDAAPDGQHHGRIIVGGVGEWQPVAGEAPSDFQQYARSMKAWVPVSGSQYHFVLGLTHDDTTGDVNLTPAGWAPELLGGVYTNGGRSATEGLDLNIAGNGLISVPLATDLLAGSIVDAPIDGMAYSRQYDNITDPAAPVWKWVPALTAGLQITGLIPDQVVFGPGEPLVTVHGYGMEFTATTVALLDGVDMVTTIISDTELTFVLNPAVPISEQSHIVTVRDPAAIPPALVDGLGAEEFKFIVPSIQVDYGTGLSFDTSISPPIVNLQPAQNAANAIGGVYVVERTRTETQGLELNADGELKAPLATSNLAGSIIEPFPDGKGYVRMADPVTMMGMWVPPADTPGYDYGTGLAVDRTPETLVPPELPIVNLQPAQDAPNAIGGVYVIDRERNNTEGLELGIDGRLRVPLATDSLAGSIVEPPPDDKGYVRRRDLNGVSAWVPPADPADTHYVIGLTHDDVTGDVNLTPAGDAPEFLGGVYVIDRVRNNTEGLELGIDGRLRVPLATDSLAGAIVEPPPDDKGYVRRRDLNGVSAWVPPADPADTHYVLGLTHDDVTGDVNLTPAGWSPDLLGGVYGEMRSATNGLDLSITGNGFITAPLATDLLAGTHTEPTPDGLAYSRQWDVATSKWIWTPAQTAGLQITGLIPDKAIIGDPVLTVHAYGAEFTPTCVLMLDGADIASVYVSPTEMTFQMNPAVPTGPITYVVTVKDPAAVPPALVDGIGAEAFEFIVSSTNVEYGSGLWLDTSLDPPLVNLQPAGDTSSRLGGVWVPRRDEQQGLELDTVNMTGELKVPLATPFLAGAMIEPPQDDKGYVRRTDITTGIGAWVPPASQSSVTISDTAPPNPVHEDLWWESDSGKMFIYYDDGTSAQWVEAVPASEGRNYNFVLGLVHDDVTDDVNLTPAGWSPQLLGGVYGEMRSATNGLDLSITGNGFITAPLATEALAGTIVEPPPDGLPYVRKRDIAGVSTWVPPTGGVIISDTPPPNPTQGAGWWESDSGDLFIWYDDGTSAQWVQVNGVSPPPGVTVADDPPMSPTPNALWWDSNAGTLNLWYTDVDTSQWVQIAAPQIPGVPEAPIDGVPYSRRDANWVATTSLAATPGDVKDGFQTNDHGGWIKLDGRLVNTLTSTQQAQANLLGFTTNLPDAGGAFACQDGGTMGAITGSSAKTITVANLPAHNMTTGGHDAGAVTTSSYDPGAVTTSNALNETAGDGPNKGNVASGGTGDDYWLANGTHSLNHSHTVDMPAHTHTVDMPNHTHTVALGGSGTPLDVTPKRMSINKFVFLGA